MQPQRNVHPNTQNSRQARRRIAKEARSRKGGSDLRTENVGAMVQVAEGLRLSGRYEEAENLWQRIMADFPDQPQPYVGLGALLSQLDRHAEAYNLYKKAVTIAPNEFVAWLQFGHCLQSLHQTEAAIIAFKKAIALQPNRVDSHCDLALAFSTNGQPDEALACYDKAIQLKPAYAQAYLGRGIQLQTLGRFDEARACLLKAIELDPNDALAHFRLASMDHSPEEASELLKRLGTLQTSGKLPKADRITAWFSSAGVLHAQEDHDGAFQHYATGNNILREDYKYDRAPLQQRVDRSIECFTPDVFETHKSAGSPSCSPIFIVGMPRSGSTLVETIIASHPDVHAGGEDHKMGEIAESLEQASGALEFPRDIEQIKPAHLLPFGTQYLSHMARLHSGAKRTTDKLLFNFLHLGVIAILFPKATIINCVRDPVDTCLSCYFQLFNAFQDLSFTNDLSDLGFAYAQYRRLMAHWHKVLTVKILDVKYEDLIASQEEVSRAMIAHTGLEWHDACLHFHQQERTVNTASHAQVRKPIYKSSIEKWRKYEAHLGPLHEALGKMS